MRSINMLAMAAATVLLGAGSLQAGVLANSGFEDGAGTAATSWVGAGQRMAAAANTGSYGQSVVVGMAQEARVQQDTAIGTITAGQTYNVTVDLKAVTDIVAADTQIWVQWFNSTTGFVGQNFTNVNLTSSYATYTYSDLIAPTGADWASVFFRVATGAVDGAGGTIYVDNFDMSTNAVPEPASLGLLSIAGLGLLRRRRA